MFICHAARRVEVGQNYALTFMHIPKTSEFSYKYQHGSITRYGDVHFMLCRVNPFLFFFVLPHHWVVMHTVARIVYYCRNLRFIGLLLPSDYRVYSNWWMKVPHINVPNLKGSQRGRMCTVSRTNYDIYLQPLLNFNSMPTSSWPTVFQQLLWYVA